MREDYDSRSLLLTSYTWLGSSKKKTGHWKEGCQRYQQWDRLGESIDPKIPENSFQGIHY